MRQQKDDRLDYSRESSPLVALPSQGEEAGPLARRREICVWTYDEHHDKWDTDCGHAHYFANGGPKDNHFKSCPFCTKRLKEKTRGAWRKAIGAAPGFLGDELPEDVIRRSRDDV